MKLTTAQKMIKNSLMDQTPRYAPLEVMIAGMGMVPVVQYQIYPPGNPLPPDCPITPELTVLQMRTQYGSRWYGFEKAWINSEFKAVVQGFPKADEVRSRWKKCNEI